MLQYPPLQTGHASLTAVYEVDGEDQDIAIEVCRNGPAVPEAVDALVRRSIAWLGKDWGVHPV
jgi:hypothetical protein